jgi:hypothetical protein
VLLKKKKGKKENLPVEYMKIIGKKVPTRTRYVNPIYRSFIKKKKMTISICHFLL